MPLPPSSRPGLTSSSSDDKQTIVCLFCHKPQQVARRAMTVTCRHCHKPLKLEDMTIKTYESRKTIATLGTVTIEKKGSAVVQDSLKCGGLVVRGKIKGAIESVGPVLIGPDADVKGNVTAPSLAVGAGAVLEGYYEIGPKDEPAAAAAAADPKATPPTA
jgi:hypothetical protein